MDFIAFSNFMLDIWAYKSLDPNIDLQESKRIWKSPLKSFPFKNIVWKSTLKSLSFKNIVN